MVLLFFWWFGVCPRRRKVLFSGVFDYGENKFTRGEKLCVCMLLQIYHYTFSQARGLVKGEVFLGFAYLGLCSYGRVPQLKSTPLVGDKSLS